MNGIGKLLGLGFVVIAFALAMKDSAEESNRLAPAGTVENCASLSPEDLDRYMRALEAEDFATVQRFEKECKR